MKNICEFQILIHNFKFVNKLHFGQTNYIFPTIFEIYDSVFRFYVFHSYSIICKNILSSSSFLFFPSSYFSFHLFPHFPICIFFFPYFPLFFFLFPICTISSIWSAISYERRSLAPALSAVPAAIYFSVVNICIGAHSHRQRSLSIADCINIQ